MLNEMVLCEELFHSPSGVAFADFITQGHRETWPIRSQRFRTWLTLMARFSTAELILIVCLPARPPSAE
jgi:hypothetical protein